MLLATAILSFGAASAQAGGGNEGNPGILPPQSHPLGKTYGEWTAAWWQWALSIPAPINPLTDMTGEFAGVGQQGPVWLLAGTFGSSVERTVSVPTGKTIFLPVFNWIFGSGVFDCDPTVPGVSCDLPFLRATAAANTLGAEAVEVWIDNAPVHNIRSYRAYSPVPFPITYPENSVIGVASGTYYPQIADGYWLMLTPMTKGPHTIKVHVKASNTSSGPIEFTLLLHLHIVPGDR